MFTNWKKSIPEFLLYNELEKIWVINFSMRTSLQEKCVMKCRELLLLLPTSEVKFHQKFISRKMFPMPCKVLWIRPELNYNLANCLAHWTDWNFHLFIFLLTDWGQSSEVIQILLDERKIRKVLQFKSYAQGTGYRLQGTWYRVQGTEYRL